MAQTDANIQNVSEKAHDAVDKAAQAAKKVEQKARQTTEQMKEKASETIETVKQASGNAQDQVTAYVNANPMKSIGIAFGAGLVAAALLRK